MYSSLSPGFDFFTASERDDSNGQNSAVSALSVLLAWLKIDKERLSHLTQER